MATLVLLLAGTPARVTATQSGSVDRVHGIKKDDAVQPRKGHCVQANGQCSWRHANTVTPALHRLPGDRISEGGPLGIHIGAAYTNRARYTSTDDGTVGVGISVGDLQRLVVVEVFATFYSTVRRGFFNRAGLDLELYRLIPGNLVLAAGWENLVAHGDSDIDASQYIAISRWLALRGPEKWLSGMTLAVGAGNGRFVTEPDWVAGRDRFSPIASIALQAHPTLSVIADWTGDELIAGPSLHLLWPYPLDLSFALTDLTDSLDSAQSVLITLNTAIRVRLP
jgi:hypothetical protein